MGPVNTPGENVERAVGGDGPVRRPPTAAARRKRTVIVSTTLAVAAVLAGFVIAPAASAATTPSTATPGAGSATVGTTTARDAATAAQRSTTTADEGGGDGDFLPGATPDPSDTPTGPVFGHPTPTNPPSSTPPVPPTIADPGDITTGTARFHGTGTPGHHVRVASGRAVSCSTVVGRDGTWACLGTVTSGPAQVFTATDTDAPSLGSVAAPSSDVITPPTLATTGTSNGTVAGDGRAGARVTVGAAGSSAGWDATVGADGRWTVSLPRSVRDGRLELVASQTASTATGYRSDLRSAVSAPRTLTLDRTVPAAPRILDPGAGDRVRTQPLVVSGSGEPRAVVTVAVDRSPVCIATVSADGTWACSTARSVVRPGAHSLTALQRDAAGNTSRSSTPVAVVVTVASAGPTATTGSGTGTPGPTTGAGTTTGAASGHGPDGSEPSGTGPAGGSSDGGHDGSTTGGAAAGSSGSGPNAGASGGRGLDWSGPAGDWSARTAYDQAVPTIQSVFSWRTVVIATAVAAGFLVLIAAPLAVVAGVARGRIRSPFAALLGRNRPRTGRSGAEDALPTWVSVVSSVTIATLCTVLGTGISLEARYVRLAVAVAVGSALLTAAFVLATRWAAGHDRHLVGHRVSPVLVLAALVACALTRAGDLSPALVVGVVLVPTGRADLGTGPMRLGSEVAGRLRGATWRSAALLVLAVAGWGVHSVAGRGGFWTSLVSDVAITLCVGGLGAAVVSLLPFTGSAGAALLAGARGRYAALVLVATALAAAVYSGSTGTHVAPAAWVVAVVLSIAAAVAARLWARADATAPS